MLSSFLRHVFVVGVVAALAAGCGGDDLLGSDSAEVTGERTWKLPTEVLAAGRLVRNEYDAAPLWRGASACAGRLRDGARDIGVYLRDRYTVIDTVGGYACRRNTADSSRMSVHGTGRALDLMIPKRGGGADSTRGDVIANFLVTNASKMGVQLIIWNRTIWRANGTNASAYGGPHPHDDHIHVELTNEAARKQTPWFQMSADGGGVMDAGVADGSSSLDDENEDASAPMRDAAADARPKDAGTTTPDAAAIDAGQPEEADAGAPSDDEAEPQEGSEDESADPGGSADGYDYEVPEGNDDAAEDDALAKTSKRRPPLPDLDDPAASSGCSAAPGGSSGGGIALGAVVAIGAVLAKRRRR
jgi:MYXO-CTERM domain-containing protein